METLYPSNGNDCDTISVSFTNDIMPIIQGNCMMGCHVTGGSGVGIFENYEGVKDKVDNGSLELRVLVMKDMPPPGLPPLNDCQLSKIQSWLDAGAPNN